MNRNLSEALVVEGYKHLREQFNTIGSLKAAFPPAKSKFRVDPRGGGDVTRMRDLPDGGYQVDSNFLITGRPTRTARRTDNIAKTDEFVKDGTVYASGGIFSDDRSKTRNTRGTGRGDMSMKDVSRVRADMGMATLRDRIRNLLPEQTRPDTFGDQPVGRGLKDRVRDASKGAVDVAKKGGSRLLDRLIGDRLKRTPGKTNPRPGMPNIPPGRYPGRLGPIPGMPGQRPMTGPLIRPGSGQPIMDKLPSDRGERPLRRIDKGGQAPTPPTRRQTY